MKKITLIIFHIFSLFFSSFFSGQVNPHSTLKKKKTNKEGFKCHHIRDVCLWGETGDRGTGILLIHSQLGWWFGREWNPPI